MSQIVGRVTALNRYLVKSMQGESLDRANIYWYGLEGDRRYAFVRGEDRSSFPWLTARELPRMLLYRPLLADPAAPRQSPVMVSTPNGDTWPIDSRALLAELQEHAGESIWLLHQGSGSFDSLPLSLISHASVNALSERAALPPDPSRFRANIVVEMEQPEAFGEERWIGARLRFGTRPDAPRVCLVRPIERCMMINLDPQTARQTPSMLRATVQMNGTYAAVHGVVEQIGPIEVGDPIVLDA